MDWRQQQQLAKKAAMEAERMRLFAKIPHTAPIDPIETAIRCGCQVRFVSVASLEGIYSPVPQPVILLGSERSAGRRTYTSAHELAHHVFKHGMQIEELYEHKRNCNEKPPEEFLADVFAGHLLMSKSVVCHALKERCFTALSLLPEQVYRLANYFGVGYGTVINHLTYSLKLIPRQHADTLLKIKPKQIKAKYGASADSEVVLVDFDWRHRAVDLEVGDSLVLPKKAEIENGKRLQIVEGREDCSIYRATAAGYARAFCLEQEWAVNIRVSRKKYVGLAQYRFFEETEDE